MLLEICVCVLIVILFIAQLFLAIRQVRKKTYDGKILLCINIGFIVIWIPLATAMFITKAFAVRIIWFVISALYMIFTMWYTNSLQKNIGK